MQAVSLHRFFYTPLQRKITDGERNCFLPIDNNKKLSNYSFIFINFAK